MVTVESEPSEDVLTIAFENLILLSQNRLNFDGFASKLLNVMLNHLKAHRFRLKTAKTLSLNIHLDSRQMRFSKATGMLKTGLFTREQKNTDKSPSDPVRLAKNVQSAREPWSDKSVNCARASPAGNCTETCETENPFMGQITN